MKKKSFIEKIFNRKKTRSYILNEDEDDFVCGSSFNNNHAHDSFGDSHDEDDFVCDVPSKTSEGYCRVVSSSEMMSILRNPDYSNLSKLLASSSETETSFNTIGDSRVVKNLADPVKPETSFNTIGDSRVVKNLADPVKPKVLVKEIK